MAKPVFRDGYSDRYTVECERVLVTLLRGLGPWKDSVYLIGGLVPRYLVTARPPLEGRCGEVVAKALDILRNRFASDERAEGYLKDGPVSVAKFELGEGGEPSLREARALRQRQASDVIEQLLARIGS